METETTNHLVNDGPLPRPSDHASIVSSLKPAAQESSFEYYMPAEWEEHSACMILFPHNPDTFRVEKASKEIMELALTIATVGKEAVYFLCKNAQTAEEVSNKFLPLLVLEEETKSQPQSTPTHRGGDLYASAPIFTIVCPSNDTWARDTGPTFVFRRQRTQEQEELNIDTADRIDGKAPTTERKITKKEHPQSIELIGMDWDFNAYGGPEEGCYWPCTEDRKIARLVCSETTLAKSVTTRKNKIDGVGDTHDSQHHCDITTSRIAKSLSIHSSVSIPMILEGGSFHTDGNGTLLTTSECLLHSNRNPHLTQSQIEDVLKLSLGVTKVLWLPHGLDADGDTNGHVDNFCCFVQPGHVVLAWTDHDDHDGDDDDGDDDNDNDDVTLRFNNYRRCREAYEYLQSTKDAKGRTIEVTKLYLPSPSLRYTKEEALTIGNKEEEQQQQEGQTSDDDDDATAFARYPGERMAASYVNFYIANKAILVPQFAATAVGVRGFGDDDRDTLALAETDRKALETLRPLFPGRTVVGIPSREILLGGGNIHCQTQQVPSI